MKTTSPFVCIFLLLPLLLSNCQNPITDKPVISKRETNAGLLIDFKKYGLVDLVESHQFREIICQSWDNKEDYEDNKEQVGSTAIDLVSRGYCFFTDGTAVKNPRGEYTPGTWVLNDSKKPYTINVKLAGGQQETFQVAVLKPFGLTLNIKAEGGNKLVEFVGPGLRYKDETAEPFYPAANKWRARPTSPETDAMIAARLKGCIHFFVQFYQYNIETLASRVNLSSLPSCFRWYAGGIFLYKEKDLPPGWINCFYNNQQAMKAYKMAEELLSKKYTWPKGETNWLKQNVYVLKQMEANL